MNPMNRSLRQLFIAIIVLFTILGLSTTVFMVVRANTLNEDPRNTRALYHEYAVPRGSITASDGTVLAQSTQSNDAFQYKREYPGGSLYAPITGYFSVVSRAGHGIEASENALLTGQTDSLWYQRLRALFTGQANHGATIETSIDPSLQKLAVRLLAGRRGAVVAMDPRTGRILALASSPSYDPNQLATHDTKAATRAYQELAVQKPSPLNSVATQQLFPPGSSFKIVVAAAALESGKYTPDTQVSSPSSYILPGTHTPLTNSESWRYTMSTKLSLEDAFAYSSNTAFAQIGVSLGADQISSIANHLGFGSPITIDGSQTSGTPMRTATAVFPAHPTDAQLALNSIGQGSTTETVLQNAMIASAVANNGTLMQPTLVDRVRSADLSVISQTTPSIFSHPFSSTTADQLNQMMQAVVTKGWPQLEISPSIQVAAKTGTAQTGFNNQGATDNWITGFAPASNPKIAVAVMIQGERGFGGTVAGPVMKQVMEAALK
jgi:peptidoglycan glycosyltransferase